MHFREVLSDIEQLVGQELRSINPKTSSIYISSVDQTLEKYFVSNTLGSKGVARSFRELEDIWNELSTKGFCNVDQALYGGGSSRNQPETVFAHLPYIQYFRYKNRKHLLLRSKHVHQFGELSELQAGELRAIRKKVDDYVSLSNQYISDSQSRIITSLEKSLELVSKKYPGDLIIADAEGALVSLKNLNQEVLDSVVSLDGGLPISSLKIDSNVDSLDLSVEELMDDESHTGIANTKELDDDNLSITTGKTKIRQLTPVVSLIYDRLSFNEIELQPDFQRKDRVWPELRKSKLIESMLMGLPLPVFYFAEKQNGDWIIVDGLQRITTIFDFMRGEFALNGLEVLEKFNGLEFSQLERSEQRKIREYPLTAHLIDMATDKDNIIVELFHRINTYGVKLSEQEIRSALNQGSSVKFLRYLAATKEFKIATQNKVKAERQKDMELCLSALAFMLQGYNSFKNNYNQFLANAMERMNSQDLYLENQINIDEGKALLFKDNNPIYGLIAEKFILALDTANEVFGAYAFKKEPSSARNIPISKPLFELIVTYFSALTDQQRHLVINNSGVLIDTLYDAIHNDSNCYASWDSERYSNELRGFAFSISTSTGKSVTVKYRFEAFRTILKQSTGVDVDLKPLIRSFFND
ncbi:DUF262 domain-containing protein [Shewanella sp.]|uniref:DUF262 domain-containing protein n=1 Tax=Shewanella sp. TaxID=50422 RepID=UPI003A871BBF